MKYLIGLFSLLIFACGFKTSEGYKVGTVTTLAKSGVVFSTWETKINIVGDAINFSIQDQDAPNVIPVLREAIENGKRVRVNFTQNQYIFNTAGETHWFIRSVVYDSVSK